MFLDADFDFDFVSDMQESRGDEIFQTLNMCSEQIEVIQGDIKELEGTEDIKNSLNSQLEAIQSINEQFTDFYKKTMFIQQFAK